MTASPVAEVSRQDTSDLGELLGRRAALVSALVGFLCYVNAIPNDYAFDGKPIVERSGLVNEPGQWLTIWQKDLWYDIDEEVPLRDLLYRPVTITSYRLVRVASEAALGAAPAWPHHLTNVCLHTLLCAMVVALLRRVGVEGAAALVGGLAFAVMPIHVDVVANIVGRADLLATIGTVGALLAHRQVLRSARVRGRVWWSVAGAAAAFLAMASKESGASVLLLVPMFDAYWHLTHGSGRGLRSWVSVGTVLRLSYLAAPFVLYVALRLNALGGKFREERTSTKTINIMTDAPAWQRALGAMQLWGMYWYKTFVPITLCIEYGLNTIRPAVRPWQPDVVIGLGVTALLVWASVHQWRRGRPVVALLSLAVVAAHLPTSNTFALIQIFFAERLWYSPSVFVCGLIGLAAAPLLDRRLLRIAGVLVLAAMLLRCWVRNREWHDNGTLFLAAERDHPDGAASVFFVGAWLGDQGRYDEAIEKLQRALLIDQGFTDVHRVLGQVYLRAGNLEKAVEHLQTAEMQVPNDPLIVRLLKKASAALAQQRAEELESLRAAADAAPQDVAAEVALVERMLEMGQSEQALRRLEAGEERFGEDARWNYAYGHVLLYAARSDAAISRLRRAAELDPQTPQYKVELAMLLVGRRFQGDMEEARTLAEAAVAQAPQDPFALVCLAEVNALNGNLQEAHRLYVRALQRIPADTEEHRMWSERLRSLGG